jgi:hypothetical protein
LSNPTVRPERNHPNPPPCQSPKKSAPTETIKDAFEKLMLNAYHQALRTKEYIEHKREVVFNTQDNRVLKIQTKDIKKIFLINTT